MAHTAPAIQGFTRQQMDNYARNLSLWRIDPILFVKDMWGLVPQPPKPEYKDKIEELKLASYDRWQEMIEHEVTPEWWGDPKETENGYYEWYSFEKGKHITWQQWLILLGAKKAIQKDSLPKLSIASGHGIGKSAVVSWIILWFLYCHYDSQMACTAPTAYQMHDVLWKELAKWIRKMASEDVQDFFDWKASYVRMAPSSETWFARAQTSSKENTEALAGVHAEHVGIAVDEASGVAEQVFTTAEGALTSGNTFIILISNPTRNLGYFYDTHHRDKKAWQRYRFSSKHSPIVDKEYVERAREKHGEDSDEYRIRVKGMFPKEGAIDDKGYVPLLTEKSLHQMPEPEDIDLRDFFVGRKILGVDPAGEGKDRAIWVLRDTLKAMKIAEEITSSSKTIAQKTITIMDMLQLDPKDVIIDAFGVGANVSQEIAIASKGKFRVNPIMLSDRPETDAEKELYLNLRALYFYRSKQWLQSGGEIVRNKRFFDELLSIRYRRNLSGKIQVMPKVDMKKEGIPSPNIADAFSLTFAVDLSVQKQQTTAEKEAIKRLEEQYDPHSVI